MSSQAGMDFGDQHQEKYAKVLDNWTDKVDGVSEVNSKLEMQWGADLLDALSDPIMEALLSKDALSQWTKHVDLPSTEALKLFSRIAAKYSLAYASPDLLRRLANSVKLNKENPIADKKDAVTAASPSVTGDIRIVRPSELVNRAPQTVAQVYDMAKDKFNTVLNNFLTRDQQLTGRRRWVTSDSNSRHSVLNNVIKDADQPFTYKRKPIEGPRPVGGNPADWSNCSCRTQVQRRDGTWLDVTD